MKDTIKNRNQKSLRNLIPEDELINRGVIFYQLPHLLMIYSGLSVSKSDSLLKQERLLTDNSDLTSDASFYRKIREDNISRDDIYKYLSKMSPSPESLDDGMSYLDAYAGDLDSVGGWSFLDLCIRGMKRSNISSDLHNYLDFVLSLCELDKELLDGTNTHLDDEFRTLFPYDGKSESIDKQAQFLIPVVLHWAALFEHFLIIDQAEPNAINNSTPFIFNKYVPNINQQGGIQCSNEIFFDWINSWWAKHKYSKEKISWPQFSRDVADAMTDTASGVDPESIRKNILRMRKGGQPLTIKSFESNVAALYVAKEDFNKFDSTRMIIPFIQLFDNIQKKYVKEGISQEYIVEQFERYSDYFDLVSRRYNNFCVEKL